MNLTDRDGRPLRCTLIGVSTLDDAQELLETINAEIHGRPDVHGNRFYRDLSTIIGKVNAAVHVFEFDLALVWWDGRHHWFAELVPKDDDIHAALLPTPRDPNASHHHAEAGAAP